MKPEELTKEKLWPVLIQTVHTLVMYPNHKAYTRDNILRENHEPTPEELAAKLNISLGEALIILYELTSEKRAEA